MKQIFSWRQWWTLAAMICASAHPRKQPHIVFILLDDMGWNDVSFHGSDQIQTPNIDSLAYDGIILKNYYSEAICTPARTALLTGKYPIRLGMQGFPLYNSEDRGLPISERLLPQYLKKQGYASYLVGKWHLGMSREEYLPTKRGYDYHYGMRGGFVDYYTYNKVESWPNGRQLYGLDLFENLNTVTDEDRYIVDVLTEKATHVIQLHNASQPMFLHLTLNAPHAGNPAGLLQPPLYTPIGNGHVANSDRRLYAAMVNNIDHNVGAIVEALAVNGMLDDTLIVFASDNGGQTVGEMRNWAVNLPLRGKKSTPWEGAVRVPAFIWHSSFKPKVWDGLMHISDWLPTLVAAAGGQVTTEIDGVNQWAPIIEGGISNRNQVLITVDDTTNTFAAYRAGDYKLVVGNVTGMDNEYYGAELMALKGQAPNYYDALRTSRVSRILETRGTFLSPQTVLYQRDEAMIKQLDTIRDPTPCIPTLTRGCLYNLRRDPEERHDLWTQAPQIAELLMNRLGQLWAQVVRRGPLNIQLEADPARFGYTWSPWLPSLGQNKTDSNCCVNNRNKVPEKNSDNIHLSVNFRQNRTVIGRSRPVALLRNCDGTTGLRNLWCIITGAF